MNLIHVFSSGSDYTLLATLRTQPDCLETVFVGTVHTGGVPMFGVLIDPGRVDRPQVSVVSFNTLPGLVKAGDDLEFVVGRASPSSTWDVEGGLS